MIQLIYLVTERKGMITEKNEMTTLCTRNHTIYWRHTLWKKSKRQPIRVFVLGTNNSENCRVQFVLTYRMLLLLLVFVLHLFLNLSFYYVQIMLPAPKQPYLIEREREREIWASEKKLIELTTTAVAATMASQNNSQFGWSGVESSENCAEMSSFMRGTTARERPSTIVRETIAIFFLLRRSVCSCQHRTLDQIERELNFCRRIHTE